MKVDKETVIYECCSRLKRLNISKIVINEFWKNGRVPYFVEGALKHAVPEFVLLKIKEVEEAYSCIVYAVTHDQLWFGETINFLITSYSKEDWNYEFSSQKKEHYIFCYVYNRTIPQNSECGSALFVGVNNLLHRFS